MDRDALGGILNASDIINPGEESEVPVDPFCLKLQDRKNFRFLGILPNLPQEGLGAAAEPGGRRFEEFRGTPSPMVLRRRYAVSRGAS